MHKSLTIRSHLLFRGIHVRFLRNPIVATSSATYWKDTDIIKVELIPERELPNPGPSQGIITFCIILRAGEDVRIIH
ncbi:hypothetical protein DTO166G4_1397 [Paecilomyces variotii]|nr:hypothetical protein DTO166G4_1397 [Paecilomyces variotii]KAJ9226240.1 hypothetical protein DTO169C6_1453 [Paecilomyces variotii]KAJ9242723.1 hypothetical protein DTO166G5_478 [Paecilomyces variotii]KAJ9258405.1 hypothetical protein DTO207G8_1580 [Paecilomyces variotii]KAJ9266478.1 hypothetical protein DTO195F2_1001 [Paecilomyces variotii]